MAYKTIPIYNLDGAVGPKKQNRPDDVKLVQSLLRIVWKKIPNSQVLDPVKVTGTLDDATRTGIVAFQTWIGDVKNILRDDVIDPMPSKRGGVDFESVAPHGHIYTIFYLNVMARRSSAIEHDNIGRQLGLVEAAGFTQKLQIS